MSCFCGNENDTHIFCATKWASPACVPCSVIFLDSLITIVWRRCPRRLLVPLPCHYCEEQKHKHRSNIHKQEGSNSSDNAAISEPSPKARSLRPDKVYIVEHKYTCSHISGAELAVDRKGVFFNLENALEKAVQDIREELDLDLDEKTVLLTRYSEYNDAADRIKELHHLDNPANQIHALCDIIFGDGVTEEIETEGVDDHTVCVDDARGIS